jgi:chromosome segregation ATPase
MKPDLDILDIRDLWTDHAHREKLKALEEQLATLKDVHEERIQGAEARIIALNETISQFQEESFSKDERIEDLEKQLAMALAALDAGKEPTE